MPAKAHNQFGLSGQDFFDYNYFMGRGKKGKKRKGLFRGAVKAALSRKQNRSTTPASAARPTPIQTVNNADAATSTAANNQTVQTPLLTGQEVSSNAITSNPEAPVNAGAVAGDQGLAVDAEMETGEESEEQYSNFLGFGKKAKEKRKLKNEEKKAGIERSRAETQLMLSGSGPSVASSASPSSAPQTTSQQANAPVDTGSPQEEQPKESENKGPNMTMILVIVAGVVIVVGAGILMVTSKKQPTQKIAAPAL